MVVVVVVVVAVVVVDMTRSGGASLHGSQTRSVTCAVLQKKHVPSRSSSPGWRFRKMLMFGFQTKEKVYLAAATLLAAHGRCRRVLQSLPRGLGHFCKPSPSPQPPFCAPSKNQQKRYVFQQMGTHAPGNRPQSAGLQLRNSAQPTPVSVSLKISFGRPPL